MEENLLSIQQAAHLLHVTTKTLRRWETRGILIPGRTSGAHRRYTISQINEFKNRAQKPQTPPQVINQIPAAPVPVISQPSPSLFRSSIAMGHHHAIVLRGRIFAAWMSTATHIALSGIVLTALAVIVLFVSIPSLQNAVRGRLGKFFNLDKVSRVNDSLFADNDLPIKGNIIFQGNVHIKGKLSVDSTILASNYPPKSSATGNNTTTTSTQNDNIPTIFVDSTSGLDIVNGILKNSDKGSSQKIFKTIKAGSTTTDATSNTDTFEFASGTGISLSLDNHNRKLTITNTGNNSSNGITDVGDGLSVSSNTVSLSLISSANGTGNTSSFSGAQHGFIGHSDPIA